MDEFNHVTIVEPHGDDALISCCTALEALPITLSTTLITLSERPSNSLIEYFDSLRKVEYKDLEDLNYKYRPKINTHEIHRMYKNDDAIVPPYNKGSSVGETLRRTYLLYLSYLRDEFILGYSVIFS